MVQDKKLKIAILLRGHKRTYMKTFDSLKLYFLNNFDCDIFLHSWDGDNDVINLYNPVKFKFEESRNIQALKILTKNKFYKKLKMSFQQQIYANYILVNMLKDYSITKNINYDYVIFSRFDIYYTNKVNKIFDNFNKNPLICFDAKQCYIDLLVICDYNTALKCGNLHNNLTRKTTYSTLISVLAHNIETIKERVGWIQR